MPACHSSSRTISSSRSSRPSPIASAVRRAMRAIWSHVCCDRRGAVDAEHRRAASPASAKPAIMPACVEPVTEHTTIVSKKTPSSRSCSATSSRPAREAEPAERMVGSAGGDRVGLPAGLLDRRERLLPALADPDVEPRRVEPHVGAHDPREQDVADLVVDDVGPVDPVLLHEHAAQPEACGDGGDLARVVRLHAADRHERVAALGERVGGEVLELAHLVAAVREPGVAVLALGPDLDAAAEMLARGARADGRATARRGAARARSRGGSWSQLAC